MLMPGGEGLSSPNLVLVDKGLSSHELDIRR